MKLQYIQKDIVCHNCGLEGHKSTFCNEEKISKTQLDEMQQNFSVNSRVMCFNCNTNGHYANMCPLKRGGCGATTAALSGVPAPNTAPNSGLSASKGILEEQMEKHATPKQTLKRINLRKINFLPFNEKELNLAIKECAYNIIMKNKSGSSRY